MKVSVLLLAYNHEPFIAKSIESVLMQQADFEYEIIIGEDYSTDRTREILSAYQAQYPNKIRLIVSPKNLGVTRNFAQVFKACKGEYIATLEGDDYWTFPHKLQIQSEFLDTNPHFAMCFTNASIVDEKDNLIKNDRVPEDKRKHLTQREIISGYCPPANTVMFRRHLIKEIPEVFYEIINADFFLFSTITEHGDAGYIDIKTAHYRVQDSGVWACQTEEYHHRNNLKTRMALLSVHKHKYDAILSKSIKSSYDALVELNKKKVKNIVISGTNFWNPGDDFVRDGVINILRNLFDGCSLNFLFYNFNADYFPQTKFSGISNMLCKGDLDKYRQFIDAVVVAGLSAGTEIKDLYNWVIANNLQDRVYLIGAGYENNYVDRYIYEEPEATIFRNAKVIIGRTRKTPKFIPDLNLPYHYINCPSVLSVNNVKDAPSDRTIEKIAFSIQLPHEIGIPNQCCDKSMYELAVNILCELSRKYVVEVVAHHKSEYFHFLGLLKDFNIHVVFSSFYQDLFEIYPRYNLVITTRLHSSLFSNGHGIPGIILNDTDRHTHCLEGFPHSVWVNTKEKFNQEFENICNQDLHVIAKEAEEFKDKLMKRYLDVLAKPLGVKEQRAQDSGPHIVQRRLFTPQKSELPIHVANNIPEDYEFDSEIKEQKLTRKLVKKGMIVLDVGANIGKYTKLLSLLVGDNGKVYAFEPSQIAFNKLNSDVMSHHMSNVTLINKAVYSRNRKVTLNEFPEEYCSWNSLGLPMMKNPKDPKNYVPIERSVEVEAVSLDWFCKKLNIEKTDYLKLDVEGVEIDALNGASELLENKSIRYLQFEISKQMLEGTNSKAKDIFDFLHKKGYECHVITEEGNIGEKATDSDAFYDNYIAFPISVDDSVTTSNTPDNLAAIITKSIVNRQVKERVLNVLLRLEKDYYLENNIERYQNALNTDASWMDSVLFLNGYARIIQPRTYLEIGVRRGRSMAQVLTASPNTKAYGFDIWFSDYGSIPDKGIHTTNPGPEFVLEQLRSLGITNLPMLIKGNSHETLPKFFTDSNNPQLFDLIVVDGDHTYKGSKEDMDIAFEHLALGGSLVFDDITHPSHPELMKLWNEYKHKFSDYIFIEDHFNTGIGVAFKPPFDMLAEKFTAVKKFETGLEQHRESDNPIHFFTIVLNGEPFIRYHIEVLTQLPFKWHWHIMEGVANLKHDTAWSLQFGGRITDEIHQNGLSNDGTTEYLDELKQQYPENITIYRKQNGDFWDGKLEMVNAPFVNINEECLLWQVDADELWTVEQICTMRFMFIQHPDKTAAYYLCHYFVGENLVITTRDTYGNHTSYEWLRTWRFKPGFSWASHEPPRLCQQTQNGEWNDVAAMNPFTHRETEAQNLIFHHFAYVLEEQLRFKEVYYGYRNAVEQWKALQCESNFPVALKNYFAWVKDSAQANTVQSQNIHPIAQRSINGQWRFEQHDTPTAEVQNILWIRTDSIGDNVLASSMLPYIHEKYRNANITVVCQEHIAELYESCPFVYDVIRFNKSLAYEDEQYRAGILRRLRSLNADRVLNSVYSREPLTDAFTIGSEAKESLAFNGNLCNISVELRDKHNQFYTRLLKSETEHKPELERHRDFLKELGIDTPHLQPIVWITPEDEQFAEGFFLKNNLSSKKTIALFAGAQGEIRVYRQYGTALSQICKDNQFTILAFGTEREHSINQQNLDDIGSQTINLSGKTTLRQTAALLKRCVIAVGAETGTAHISCAVGTKNVILLGGGHFGRFMPYSPLTSVVCLPLECYGCNWSCKYQTVHCVKDIIPKVIKDAVRETLENKSEKTRVFVQGNSLWNPQTNEPQWQWFNKFLATHSVEIIPVGDVPPLSKTEIEIPVVTSQQSVALLNIEAKQELQNGNMSGAKELLLKILEQSPNNIKALNNLAVTNILGKNWDSATDILQKVLQLDPTNKISIENSKYLGIQMSLQKSILDAENFIKSKQYPQAREILEKVLEINDKHIDALNDIAVIEISQNNYREAQELLNNILKIDASNEIAKNNLDRVNKYLGSYSKQDQTIIPTIEDKYYFKISVVTPSFNQVKYIEQTIKSVLEQNYPNFEHIIIDGGSTDGTVEILKRYPHIKWLSEKDRGQSDAINKGFQMVSGDIIAWINSDDWYESNTFRVIADYFVNNPGKNIVMGNCNLVDEKGNVFDLVINYERGFDKLKMHWIPRSIPTQPAIFFRKKLLDEFGCLDISLHYAMDYDLWMRFAKENIFYHINQTFANYRFHSLAKGGDQDWNKFIPECKLIYKRYVKTNTSQQKVSVIIPCYNHGCYLPAAVNSVLCQTYQDHEIIIVNDGSIDNTIQVAESLICKYPDELIRLINQVHQGPSMARNTGIKASKGVYILPLDADDLIHSEMLHKTVSLLDKHSKIAIAYTDVKHFGSANRIVCADEYDFKRLCFKNHLNYCALFRREAWESAGGYNPNMALGYEDWDFWISCGEKGYYGKRISEPLFMYRVKETSRNTKALEHHSELMAQIVINHQNLYDQKYLLEAKTILDRCCADKLKTAPLVSVLVPTYNRSDTLKNTLESIASQTYRHIEAVVVNDAGEDVSTIVDYFQDRLCIKYLVHNENKGLAAARNTAIKHASGEYIAYLDDDDIFYQDHIETLVKYLETNDDKVAYTDAYRVCQEKENGRYVVKQKDIPHSFDFDADLILAQNLFPVLCMMHKKSCLDEIGLFDESLTTHEDWDLWIRMSRKYHFAHIRKITCEYAWRTDSTSMSSEKRADFLRTLNIIYERNREYSKDKQRILNLQTAWIKHLQKVSIIIPVFNKFEFTQKCLEAIVNNTPGELYEVIVIDNASTDSTRDFLMSLEGDVKIITNEKNLGFSRACNQGAQMASTDYLLFLNNDTEPMKGWLEPLLNILTKDSSVGAVGGKLLFPDGTIQHAGVVIIDDQKLPDPLVARHIYYGQPTDITEADQLRQYQALTAACLLIRKSAFNEIGEFDENYWNGYEDVDLCFKLQEKGWKLVYQPESVIIHHESKSGPERFSKVSENIQRLHSKWIGKINPDIIIREDGSTIITENNKIQRYHIPNMITAESLAGKPRKPVSIIILTWNALEYTKKCILSIQTHTNYPHEVIFVDNASTDGTVEYLRNLVRERPNYKLIDNHENRGFAAGNNQGVAVASSEFVMLLNNDVLVSDGWLEGLAESLEMDEKIGMVGPITNSISGRQMVRAVPYTDENGFHDFAQRVRKTYNGRLTPRYRIAGFAVLMRKALYDEVGGLDESFGTGNYEDDDLCLKIREKGYAIMVDEGVFIHHYRSQTFIENKIDYRNSLSVNESRFREKWPNIDYEWLLELRTSLVDENATLLTKGQQALDLGNIGEAIELYSKVLKSNPIDGAALYGMGLAHQMSGKNEEAIEVYKKTIKINPRFFDAYGSLALIYSRINQTDNAISALKQAIELNNNDASAYNNLGVLYFKKNKHNDARICFEKALSIDVNYQEAQQNLKNII